MNRSERHRLSTCHRLITVVATALLGWTLLTTPLALAGDREVAAVSPRPTVSVSVLQFGTAHWALDHLKRQHLDQANGFNLDVHLVANLSASHLAVSSGSVDGAVADLLWAQARYEAGAPYVYLPFSSQIGDIVVPSDSPVQRVSDLVGRRIGVAGGPDSKGWVLLSRVAARQGIDLASAAEVQYAAPPLLSQALRRGQLDVLVTYWHFAARLRASGEARSVFRMADLLDELGLSHDLPVLGYVFHKAWAEAHPAVLQGFARALNQANQALAARGDDWDALRPLMRDPDEATFRALRDGLIDGFPAPLDRARIDDLRRLLTLAGTDPARRMPEDLFVRLQP